VESLNILINFLLPSYLLKLLEQVLLCTSRGGSRHFARGPHHAVDPDFRLWGEI